MVGHVTVQELDWSNPNHYSTVNPPFDYVLAADCVYHEQIVEDFLRTVLAVTHSKSTGLFLFLAFAPVSLSRLHFFLHLNIQCTPLHVGWSHANLIFAAATRGSSLVCQLSQQSKGLTLAAWYQEGFWPCSTSTNSPFCSCSLAMRCVLCSCCGERAEV